MAGPDDSDHIAPKQFQSLESSIARDQVASDVQRSGDTPPRYPGHHPEQLLGLGCEVRELASGRDCEASGDDEVRLWTREHRSITIPDPEEEFHQRSFG